jgi:hypothetical protein
LRKIRSVLVLTSTAFLITGCAAFDVDARDKAACDELSDLLSASSESSVPAEASPALIDALEARVLPKASASFGGTIKELIDSYKSINDKSVFDQFGGAYDTLMLGGKVLERCFELSSKTY